MPPNHDARSQSPPLTFVHGTTIVHTKSPTNNMSDTALNQVVKGAPTTDMAPPPPPAPLPPLASAEKYAPQASTEHLPSSPAQIYLNLLILESSLRSQYLHLLSRRRLNTFFLLVLSVWNTFFIYALFLRPREDGIGHGGSVYWVVEASYKLSLMGGLLTSLLIYATGQWERGVRWPRRWLGTTNRGLRTFNLRVVVVRGSWWREMLGHLSFLLPLHLLLSDSSGGFTEWHLVEHENGVIIEEDLAPGGDHIMLLLLPKSFSPEFRENWEEYRSEYWERENDRRTSLRRKVTLQRRTKAKEQGGWKWWTGAWRVMPHRHHRRNQDLEKQPGGHHHSHSQSHRGGLNEKDPRRRSLMRSDSSHSRQSSRSSTPATGMDLDGINEKPPTERVRRGSSVSSTSSVRRKTLRERDKLSPLTMTGGSDEKLRKSKRREDRPRTPDSDGSIMDEAVGRGVRVKRESEAA